jgi:hypothetical protein
MHKDSLFVGGGDERRGATYASQMLRRLSRNQPRLIPYALVQFIFKYFGYRLGFHGHALPRWLNRHLSAQSYFWRGPQLKPESPAALAELREVA